MQWFKRVQNVFHQSGIFVLTLRPLRNITGFISHILLLTIVSGCLGQQTEIPTKGWASEALPKTDDELVRFFSYPRFAIYATLTAYGARERFYQVVPPGLENVVADRLRQFPRSSQSIQNAIALLDYHRLRQFHEFNRPTIILGDENEYERDFRIDEFVFKYSPELIAVAEKFYVLAEAGYLPAQFNLFVVLLDVKNFESKISQVVKRNSNDSLPIGYQDQSRVNLANAKKLQPQVEALRRKLQKYENIFEELASQGYWPAMERRMINAINKDGYGTLSKRYAEELLGHPEADELVIANSVNFLLKSSTEMDEVTAERNLRYLDESIAKDLSFNWFVKSNYYEVLGKKREMREALAKGYELGDSSCAFLHGYLEETENGNFEEAEKAYTLALNLGHQDASMNLFALLLKMSPGQFVDKEKKMSVLEKGIELGNAYSASNLGLFYYFDDAQYSLDQFDLYPDQPNYFRQRMANLFEARRLLERAVDWHIKRNNEQHAKETNVYLVDTQRRIAALRRTLGPEIAGVKDPDQQQAEETKARMEADELYQMWLIRDMQRRDNIRIQNSLGK